MGNRRQSQGGKAVKNMKWLLVALVVLVILWGGLELRGRSKTRPQPLYPDFRVEAADRITLRNPQSTVVLQKIDGVWVAASEDSFPAEADIVQDMLVTIAAFSKKDRISSNREKQALYQVDSTGTSVVVEDGKGKAMASAVIGKTGADYQSTYVRNSTSDDVIMAHGAFSRVFNRGRRSWQDKRIFNLQPDQIGEVAIARAGETASLKRGADGAWYLSGPDSAACSQDKAWALVRTLATLRCEGFAGHAPRPEWGVEGPDSSVYFKTADGDERTLLIGHKGEGERFYAALAQGSTVYLLASRSVNALLPARSDLLTQQSAEAAERQP